ncbi:uncharacterized protein N0V89_002698 [Didymosphaeria variabile]|uniref:Galactose oxidase n=1 Tax=Didymosphaeria variabile TaxID=1932322 RepID=A0A9W9CET0_9PLEO|nr:uncharacterized protein N0V89_002698 [Didymosphaeria variabile]KAJ4358119.1 hypothetical protein N0V89_002698 [Didymosphaeria variabile]
MPISKPIWNLSAKWARLHDAERLRRSSQVLSVIEDTAYIFGGEVQPRQPVDNKIDVLPLRAGTQSLLSSSIAPLTKTTVGTDASKLDTKSASEAPSPRVGSASAVLSGCMYLFSGRGGTDMAPVEENGAVWSFDPSSTSWKLLKPADASKPYPLARSYHCATSDGNRTFFVHAGCPEKGRLSDLWRFDVKKREWSKGADAPAPQRGGTSIAYSGGKIYRMNGFDGTTEQGGSIDIYDVASDAWSAETFQADGNDGPEARSVCVLLPVRIAQKEKLLTLFGERDPSSLGHAGAGKMLSDMWIYDIAEKWWTKLEPSGSERLPDPRGWFDADVVKAAEGNDSVVVHGGLSENNERLKDVWVLSF